MLTHLDNQGRANMVDVTAKAVTERQASAQALVQMKPQTLAMIQDGDHPKGDVFAVARIAGIQAAKRTHELIPLCHPLLLTGIKVDLEARPPEHVLITATCKLAGQTGVEMEALTAASVAAETCAARGVAFVDIAPVSRARGAEPEMLAEDGLHPSAAMYAQWTRLALPVARRLLSAHD